MSKKTKLPAESEVTEVVKKQKLDTEYSILNVLEHLFDLKFYSYGPMKDDFVVYFYNSANDSGLFAKTWKIYKEYSDKMQSPSLDKNNYYFETLDNQRNSLDDFRSYALMLTPSIENLFHKLLEDVSQDLSKKLFIDIMIKYIDKVDENAFNYCSDYVIKCYEKGWEKKLPDAPKNVALKILYNHLK